MADQLVISIPVIENVAVAPNPVSASAQIVVTMVISEIQGVYYPEEVYTGDLITGEEHW